MIEQARDIIAGVLTHLDWPVQRFPPANPTHVPCVVVGRPLVEPGSTDLAADFGVQVPIVVIGRTMADEDAQRELDTVADAVIDRLLASYPFTVTADVESVAGLIYPAYTITTTVPMRLCTLEGKT